MQKGVKDLGKALLGIKIHRILNSVAPAPRFYTPLYSLYSFSTCVMTRVCFVRRELSIRYERERKPDASSW